MEVNIVSYTGYSNAVRRVVEDRLDLFGERISVFGEFLENYNTQLHRLTVKGQ
ncbi:hypothetical protein [Wolbachia endosymbiont of Brugia malayi]|uniref:hypothetical protein n=1 Tax=Wolbachia endosymbiont of Brugia malayi TaxID=80849 RepID=UPI0002E8553F|nr:hypothetical protein [Wolbachia endosymbiont of Brugia malayi]